MTDDVYFRSTDCVPVEGKRRGIIYDLGRRTYYSFPTEYVSLLKQHRIDFNELYNSFDDEGDQSDILRFKAFLIEKEIVHKIPSALYAHFPPLSFEYNDPGYINNCVADYESDSPYDLQAFINASSSIGARHFLIRSYRSNFSESDLLRFIELFEDSPIRSFELIVKFNVEVERAARKYYSTSIRCKSIVLHSAPTKEYIMPGNGTAMGILALTPQIITSPADCHNNSELYMNVNVLFYLESLYYHPYFNKKLSIDTGGLLKNCPSHNNNYGHFGKVDLRELVSSEVFQQKWKVSKDKINVCCHCEYRYMCADSRDLAQNSDGTWSHDAPCPYDPYNAIWRKR